MTISSLLSQYSSYDSGLYSSYTSSSTSSSSLTSTAVSKLADGIDADGDDSWSYEEVSDYASDYYDLTGNVISTSDIFSTYDTDGDMALSDSEQEEALDGDALGLESLSSDSDSDSESALLEDILSCGTASAYSYLMSSLTEESTSSLLSQLFGTDDDDSGSLLTGLYGTSSTAEAAAAYWIAQYGNSEADTSSMDVTA